MTSPKPLDHASVWARSKRKPPISRMAAVAAIVLIAVVSFWFDSSITRLSPSLLATTSEQWLGILWRDPSGEGDLRSFVIAARPVSGAWQEMPRFHGHYRCAAFRGDELVVFYKDNYSTYSPKPRAQSKPELLRRRHSDPWPFKWEPLAAAGVGRALWVVGRGERRSGSLLCARLEGDRWAQAKPIAEMAGRPVCVVAMECQGKLAVSVFAFDRKQRRGDLALYEWADEQWRRTLVWSSRTAYVKAAAIRAPGGVWSVTLQERMFGGMELSAYGPSMSSLEGPPAFTLRRVRDFAVVALQGAPMLVVALRRSVEMAPLASAQVRTREIVHRSSRAAVGKQFLGAIVTAFLLVLVVLAATRFARQESQQSAPLEGGDVVLASLAQRAAAFVLDYVVAFVLATTISALFFEDTLSGDTTSLVGFLLVLQTCRLVYTTGFEFASGQTLGKKIVRARVVTLDGMPLSLGAAIVRNLLRGIDEILFIGLAVMVWNPRLQRIGDLLARTIVVRVDVTPSRAAERGHQHVGNLPE